MPKPQPTKELAKERIQELFKQAKEAFGKNPKRSDKYVQLARTLAMKARISMPKNLKKKYCKHCYAYFRPSVNCRVRVRKDLVIYTCLNCKKYTKHPYGKKLKKTK
tara:strand:+ start:607 stop:924 length:318 start_codon:yes stop_codon:yes gene_type:complete